MKAFCLLAPAAFCLALAACSGANAPDATAPATRVSAVLPTRQVFHAHISAYGELAADSRRGLALSLPQAGEITSIAALAGHRVQRGAVLLQLATDPTTRSAYLQAEAQLKVAQQALTRTEHLHAQKLATNGQLDTARQALADAQANLAAQAQLGGAQAVYTLKAPANGVVTTLDVQRGQRVAAGTTLLQFTPDDALAALLGVDPGAAAHLRRGMHATLTPVYGAHGAAPLAATVAMVGGAVNPATHLVDVVATLDRPPQLAAGTALSATINTASFTAWSVPRDALQSDATGDYVFQIEHGKARRVAVKVLAPDGSPIGVGGAIDPHAPVITLGSYEVAAGDAVCSSASPTGRGCPQGR